MTLLLHLGLGDDEATGQKVRDAVAQNRERQRVSGGLVDPIGLDDVVAVVPGLGLRGRDPFARNLDGRAPDGGIGVAAVELDRERVALRHGDQLDLVPFGFKPREGRRLCGRGRAVVAVGAGRMERGGGGKGRGTDECHAKTSHASILVV